MPIKSIVIPSQETNVERSKQSIEKREQYQASLPGPSSMSSSCYQDFQDFVKRIGKLKISPWYIFSATDDYVEIRRNETTDGNEFMVPFQQIFVNTDLTFTLRCFGWVVQATNGIQLFYPSFKFVTLSNFISVLKNYHLCRGLDLVEFKEANHLQHHIIPKEFKYNEFQLADINNPVNQQEFIRSLKCYILIENNVMCEPCKKLQVKTRSELNYKKAMQVAPAKINAPITFTSPDRIKATLQSHRLENSLLKDQIKEMSIQLERNSVPVDVGNNEYFDWQIKNTLLNLNFWSKLQTITCPAKFLIQCDG